MGTERRRCGGTNVIDAQENVSPTRAQTNESDVEDTPSDAQENSGYTDVGVTGTTESGHCSTPASPTGRCSRRSNPGDFRSAAIARCGEAVFLLAAGRRLRELGCPDHDLDRRVFGIDVHSESLDEATGLLGDEGLAAHLLQSDFFAVGVSPAACLPDSSGLVDAVIGNPPFIRYQEPRGVSGCSGTPHTAGMGPSPWRSSSS